ncbi:MAG: hypothetical protein ACQESK_11325 [Bacteroidota bacterium]
MVHNFCLYVLILCSAMLSVQNLEGAWKLTQDEGKAVTESEVMLLVQDDYFAIGAKNINDNEFLGAAGGEFQIDENELIAKRDFDTYDETKVGQKITYQITWQSDETIRISNAETDQVWKRVSSKTDDLNGNWVITGRQRNGEMNTMTPGDRRTIKILAGGRFQWVAFNSADKQFMATGGGTYTTENGVYTEHISFFSKDKNRVGADLDFEYEVNNNQWHHKGKSSKGDSIYEIWSAYQEAYSVGL